MPVKVVLPGMTESQAVWRAMPAEFSARQLYAPASSRLTFDKYSTSISTR